MANKNLNSGDGSPAIDVLIICALKDEYDQLLNVTDGLHSEGWITGNDQSGRIIAEASFDNVTKLPLTIRATWASHMGREQASALASSMIQSNSVRCIAMSGICGGRRGKSSLGDVIFADRLWSYDAGKVVVEDGVSKFEGDALQFRPKDLWVQRMQALSVSIDSWSLKRPVLPLENQEDWVLLRLFKKEIPSEHPDFADKCPEWTETIHRLRQKKWVESPLNLTESGKNRASELALLYPFNLPEPDDFEIRVAPIATGAAVIEDEGIFPKLANNMRKVLGVDMEASALAAFGDIHGVPVIVAKAVSDFGDRYKDDRYRHFGAHASAQCLIKLLRESADLLPQRHNIEPASSLHTSKSSRYNSNLVSSRKYVDKIPLAKDCYTDEDLIEVLSEEYPDVRDARAVWIRAGGKGAEIENISRPKDMWQKIWLRSTQGASVTPKALLISAASDLPNNSIITHYLNLYQ
jgi:nucleoside phosphorylase